MGKFKYSTKVSRAYKSMKNFGHCKTRISIGKHMKITIGTKGIHPSIKMGPIIYKPKSGNYSVKTPVKGLKYYGNTKSKSRSKSTGSIGCGLILLPLIGLAYALWYCSEFEEKALRLIDKIKTHNPFTGLIKSLITLSTFLLPLVITGFAFYLIIYHEFYWILFFLLFIKKRKN